MTTLFKKFWKEEDGGADQLIILAILIVVGIGVALLFGDKIKAMVSGLLSDAEGKTNQIKVDKYSN